MKLDQAFSLKEVCDWVGGELLGNADQQVTGLNEIHLVEKGDLTFVDHPKYYDKVLKSAATTIIINKRVDPPAGKALIYVEEPFTAYVEMVRRFRGFEAAVSLVSNTAEIGEGTVVQPGAFIGNNVRIGKNCIIHANASIYDHCRIGDHVIIHSGAVIGADAFYYKKRPDRIDKLESCGSVILEDHVEIGACSTVDKGVSGDTVIGEYTKLDNHVQIGHDTRVGKRCIFSAHVAIAGVTVVEDDVTLWGQVGVHKDLVIGAGATVLAKSGVDKSIEGKKTYWGSPVQEARKAWKQLAIERELPDHIDKLRKLD